MFIEPPRRNPDICRKCSQFFRNASVLNCKKEGTYHFTETSFFKCRTSYYCIMALEYAVLTQEKVELPCEEQP